MPDFLASFVPQLLAAIVGAGVGVFGVVLAFRLQRRAAAEDAADQAVVVLLTRLAELASDIDRWQKEFNLNPWMGGQRPRFHYPHPAAVSIALEVLAIRVRDQDRPMMIEISHTWDQIALGEKGPIQATACGVLAGAIAKWRQGERSQVVRDSLEFARRLSAGETVASADGE